MMSSSTFAKPVRGFKSTTRSCDIIAIASSVTRSGPGGRICHCSTHRHRTTQQVNRQTSILATAAIPTSPIHGFRGTLAEASSRHELPRLGLLPKFVSLVMAHCLSNALGIALSYYVRSLEEDLNTCARSNTPRILCDSRKITSFFERWPSTGRGNTGILFRDAQ